LSAISSGRRHPWMGTGSGDALALGLEVGVGVCEADEVWPADSVGAWVGFGELVDVGDAGDVGVVPDAGGVWDAGDRSGLGLGLGEAGELGASWAQAVMITVLVAGSALPPTPLRSTK